MKRSGAEGIGLRTRTETSIIDQFLLIPFLPVIRAQSDGMPPLASAPAASRFRGIVLSQCAAARVSLDRRRHKYERQMEYDYQ